MKLDITVHIHHRNDEGLDRLGEILSRLKAIQKQGDMVMALVDELKLAINDLDVETTLVAIRIDELIAKLTSEGLSASEKAEVLASIGAETARLKTLAVDPSNPVPMRG